MKLIIIYGPPAAGKLTTAAALSEATGSRVFHNHVSIDCALSVFDFGTPAFGRLVHKIRYETLAEAARSGVDVIHTFVYDHGPDDEHFYRLIAAAEDNGGKVLLVMLQCAKAETLRRVTADSRARIGKIATPEMLTGIHERHEMYTPLPGRETLEIDNTDLPASETARLIIEHFGLLS